MKALVTGGGGFLGGAIVQRLVDRGDAVRSFARGDYPALREIGVEVVRGDLTDRAAVVDACRGCDTVFHVAARAGIWGDYDTYHGPNVVGTENVLAGCAAHAVGRLVYTSSPSVVFDGRDAEGINESTPYPAEYDGPYPRTKAIAERMVLAADGPDLATVSLRPHLIWGPGDTNLVPRIIRRAKSLRRIGSEDKLVDSIYIDNATDAHLLAADRLVVGSRIAGRAYFLSNGEPWPLWELINGILAAAGLSPITRSVSKQKALRMATWMELIYGALRIRREPRLTRFLVQELTTSHWFDLSAARRDLGYEPEVSIEEGLRRLGQWLRSVGEWRMSNVE
ncbi:MAG: NAD-dependent epimerase/dehydratase family protein [Phycisphaerae bacterium]